MKFSFFTIVAFVFTIISCNQFLRQLDVAIVIKKLETSDQKTCVTENMPATLKLTVQKKNSSDVFSITAPVVTLKNGQNSITYTCGTPTSDISDCTTPTGTPAVGTYSLDSVTESGAAYEKDAAFTFSLEFATTYELGTQTPSQEVDSKTKTFEVKLKATSTSFPKIFLNNTSTTPIECSGSNDTITCTPSATDMEDGKEYTIYYMNGCEKKDTGVKVKFSDSLFMKVSMMLMFFASLIIV